MRTTRTFALALLAIAAVATASTRNGVPTVFIPVMLDGADVDFDIFAFNPNGDTGTLPITVFDQSALTGDPLILDLNGDPVTRFPIDFDGDGVLFADPPPDVHVLVFTGADGISVAPVPIMSGDPIRECSAPFFASEEFDFKIVNLGAAAIDATLCADTAGGTFIGCSTINDVPPNGPSSTPLRDALGDCTDSPCMARVFFDNPTVGGCASVVEDDSGFYFFEGVAPDGGDDLLFVYDGDLTIGNLSSTPGDGEVRSLDGELLDTFTLPAFGTTFTSVSNGTWNQVIFADGFESGDTAAWSSLGPGGRASGRGPGGPDGFRGISAADGGNSRAAVVFPIHTKAVAAQLGALNMGTKKAKLTITYRAADGTKLGAKRRVTLKPNAFVELDLPNKLRHRVGAYADIRIKGKKSAVWPYARIEHSSSGDVTIVPGIVLS